MERKTGKINSLLEINTRFRFPSGRMWKVYKKDKVTLAGIWVVILLILLATFCYLFIPDKTQHANRTCLPIGNEPPGFTVTVLRVMDNKPTVTQNFFSKIFFGLRRNDSYIPVSSTRYEGTDIVVREYSASGDSSFESRFNIADVVYPINPQKEIIERNGGLFFETADGVAIEESINDIQGFIDGQYLVKKKFYLGTDLLGRDVLSRLLAATRTTVFTALFATLLALIAGLLTGLTAGMLKGKIKSVLVWLLQSFASVPSFLLIMAIMFVIGNGFWKLCLVTGAVLSLEAARVTLSYITDNREKKFVESAYSLGLTRQHIFRNHILPGIGKHLLATGAALFCAAILIESGLNFLGLGTGMPFLSWGSMIRENFGYIIVPGYAYLTLIPGLAIIIVSVTFGILANRLRFLLIESYNRSVA
jgi:ABC-type dipeptide/oligopeptide/nickel transport system permease subunit